MNTHVMVDLETLGTNSNAMITNIGAVKFDTDKLVITDTFYRAIKFRDGQGEYDADTLRFWLKQSEDARKELYEGTEELIPTLVEFGEFYDDSEGLWGNGASFDNVILKSAYISHHIRTPWEFYQDRCYRTITSMFGRNTKFNKGVKHNALDDARNQTQHLLYLASVHTFKIR